MMHASVCICPSGIMNIIHWVCDSFDSSWIISRSIIAQVTRWISLMGSHFRRRGVAERRQLVDKAQLLLTQFLDRTSISF